MLITIVKTGASVLVYYLGRSLLHARVERWFNANARRALPSDRRRLPPSAATHSAVIAVLSRLVPARV